MDGKSTDIFHWLGKALLVVAVIPMLFACLDTSQAQARSPKKSNSKYTDTKKLQKEMKDLEARRSRIIRQLKQKKVEAHGIKQTIETLDAEIGRVRRELEYTTLQLRKHQAQEAYLTQQLDKAVTDFDRYQDNHLDRLVSFYKNSHATYLEVLFNSSSFSDFISRLNYIRMIVEHDQGVLDTMKEMQDNIKSKRQKVIENKRIINYNRIMLQQKNDYNTDLQSQKKSTLRNIQHDVRLYEQQLAMLERENQAIQRALLAAQRKNVYTGQFTGVFGSPVCGAAFRITSPFGYRQRPTRGASSNHKGIDLQTSYGQNICAAADGVVLQAGYAGGYGNHIVLMHGSGLATVYGHGLRILVSSGQRVRKGQVIMKADSTGVSTGNHLHFEIRKNGVPINPMSMLR